MNAPAPPPYPAPIHPPWARTIKRYLPRGLFARTLLIIVVPTLLALCVATFVFFDRHWTTITNRLTYAVAGDVAAIVELMRTTPDPDQRAALVRLANRKMDLSVTFTPGARLHSDLHPDPGPLRAMMKKALSDRLPYPFAIDVRHGDEVVAIDVETPEGLYSVLSPERRVYTPTTEAFIAWMVGSSIGLSAIALLFMRNQIRPIRRLAAAAEAIGKGQDVPWFRPAGAAEVRQAAAALLVMRDRLRRQITQRTAMLAGVSHDLRTPLTRMKLQLALMPESPETRGFAADIADMESMLEAYLAFARGEESEPATPLALTAFLTGIIEAARRQHPDLLIRDIEDISLTLRAGAMKRCIGNLVGNACRYGKHAEISATLRDHAVDIIIDDDGPGIAPDRREDVFRPFLRLDESRNPGTGGVGLGLTIARDIARSHGGDVLLEDSPLGGLRARLWLPV